ncbi:hypothetical protein [Halomonas sp. HG01]|uniref:hypothetical protein n=1 Tax=Halomonas sp. HG01 TaxID=1609967 RepID=UPI0006145738|nr:hypothetical protein [Halomonas sp. HG01]
MNRASQRRLDALEKATRESEFQRDVAMVSEIMDELSAKAAGADPHERQPDSLSDYLEGTA